MKKFFSLALVLVATMALNAKQVVFDFTNPTALGITPSTEKSKGVELPAEGIVVDGVTMTSAKVQKNPNVLFTKSDAASYELRTYNQNTITFAAEEAINAIEFVGDAHYAELTGTTWTGEATTVTFTGNSTSKITSITVYIGETPEVWVPDTVSVAEAIKLIDAKDAKTHYVAGIVATAPFDQFSTFGGRVSFYLVDDLQSTDSLQAYQIYGEDNAKWASLEDAQKTLHVGDTVLVYAGGLKLYEAKNIYEIDPGYFVEVLGANPDATDPEDETPELPEGVISCAQAIEATANLADPTAENKTVKGEAVVVRGYVTYAYDEQNGKQSAWLDDKKGGKGLIQAAFLQVAEPIAKGDYVEVSGTLAKYFKAGKNGNPDEIIVEVVDGTMGKVGAQGIENIVLTEKAQKVVVDGVIYIVRDNKMFNLQGAQVR